MDKDEDADPRAEPIAASDSGGEATPSSSNSSYVDSLLRAVAHAPLREPVPLVAPGSTWGDSGRYVIERALGRGGMGRVYAAKDSLLARPVAIKILDGQGEISEAVHRARLLREARAAATVEHERIARIYDVGEHKGALFLAMEFVQGGTLRAHLDRERDANLPVDVTKVVRIVRQMLEGLAALHARGIIHRDLKPENVMLAESGVKLLDFGLAKAPGAGEVSPSAPTELEGVSHGGFAGTPGYMAPEQCRGEPADARADLFSLGVLIFEMIERRRPYTGATPFAIVEATRNAGTPKLTVKEWKRAAGLRALVEKALVNDREQRCKTVDEALELVDVRRSWRAKPSLLSTFVLLGICLCALVALLLSRRASRAPSWVVPAGMVRIAGGDVQLGSTDEELRAECERDGPRCPDKDVLAREKPAFTAHVPPFVLDINEVTNEDFAKTLSLVTSMVQVPIDDEDHYPRFVTLIASADGKGEKRILYDLWRDPSNGIEYAANPARSRDFQFKPGLAKVPVRFVSWYGANFFCQSRGKRLPTENEWETAARGVENRRYPWGAEAPRCHGVQVPFDGELPADQALSCPGAVVLGDVGSSAQDVTPDGVHDLGGSVSEWVDATFDPTSRAANPPTDSPAVFKGASYAESVMVRPAGRNRYIRSGTAKNIGFRCAADLAE